VLLVAYWELVQSIGYKAFYGETGLHSGLLKLQSLADSKGASNIVIGTSLTAKIKAGLIFEKFDGMPINLGLDGGVPIFGAKKILESATKPKILLIETNYLGKQPNSNMVTLEKETQSVLFKVAQYIPVLRQEYRPVTLFYSELKSMKDDLSTPKGNYDSDINSTIAIKIDTPSLFKPDDKYNVPIEKEWGLILDKLKNNGTRVIFFMIPDGKRTRELSYAFTRYMAAKYDIPFIDLKTQLQNENIFYSDELHLIKKSAIKVSKILNQTLIKNKGLIFENSL
jgi:hypothetical protein